jgi:hypothetical protein
VGDAATVQPNEGESTRQGSASPLERLGTPAPPWPKGKSANPGGRPKLEKVLVRRSRELTIEMLPDLVAASRKLASMIEKSDKPEEVIAMSAQLNENFQVMRMSGFGKVPERIIIEDDSPAQDVAVVFLQELKRRRDEALLNGATEVQAKRLDEPGDNAK